MDRNSAKAMSKVKIALLSTLVACVASVPPVALLGGFVGQSKRRIEREHGLKLPPSAVNFECRGDALLVLQDRGAATAFEIKTTDLPVFVAQLKVRQCRTNSTEFIFPANPQYQVRRPWMVGSSLIVYECISPVGSFLNVQIWGIDDRRVGVCLYTDWN